MSVGTNMLPYSLPPPFGENSGEGSHAEGSEGLEKTDYLDQSVLSSLHFSIYMRLLSELICLRG